MASKDPGQGSPVPSFTPKLCLESPLSLEPLPRHGLPSPEFSPTPTPTYRFLLHLGVSTWLWGPWLLCTPLSTCLALTISLVCVCLSV